MHASPEKCCTPIPLPKLDTAARLGERTAAALRPRDCSALGCSARHTTALWLLLLLLRVRVCGWPASGLLDESIAAVDIAPALQGFTR